MDKGQFDFQLMIWMMRFMMTFTSFSNKISIHEWNWLKLSSQTDPAELGFIIVEFKYESSFMIIHNGVSKRQVKY